MELNWSTFILEMINFLVLIWILKRFFYRPVLSALEKRRNQIEQDLNEATLRHTQASELEQKYKERLEDWALEKTTTQGNLTTGNSERSNTKTRATTN